MQLGNVRANAWKGGREVKRLLIFTGAIAAFAGILWRRAAFSIPGRKAKLDDLTKDELYRKAQDADVPGRSDMTKQELADALKEQ